jgi:hypothetical protein
MSIGPLVSQGGGTLPPGYTSNSPWARAVPLTQGTTRSAAQPGRVLPMIICSLDIYFLIHSDTWSFTEQGGR